MAGEWRVVAAVACPKMQDLRGGSRTVASVALWRAQSVIFIEIRQEFLPPLKSKGIRRTAFPVIKLGPVLLAVLLVEAITQVPLAAGIRVRAGWRISKGSQPHSFFSVVSITMDDTRR